MCRSILSRIRGAMLPGSRLFVVEMLVSDNGTDSGAAQMDMAMLLATTGQERDLRQLDALLSATGPRRTRRPGSRPGQVAGDASA